jgi:TatD DNase family protein
MDNTNQYDTVFIDVRTSVGVHPFHTEEEGRPTDTTIDSLNRLIEIGLGNNVLSCVGECGLDYSPSFPPLDIQIPWFQVQLDLACKYDLPLFLHERLAFHDVITCLDEAKKRNNIPQLPPVVIHCFTGTVEECQEYVARDFYIGITGYILKKGDGPAEVWRGLSQGVIPLNRLLIETDAPYMGFPGCRDLYWKYEQHNIHNLSSKARKRIVQSTSPNVPSSLPLVLRGIVTALNQGRLERGEEILTEEQVGRICTQNAINFFGFTKLKLPKLT